MNTFWSDLGVVGGNTSATNQYDLWKGITFNDGFVCASQYDFFTHLGTNRYEFFKSYNSVDSNIVSEYTFYQNTSDPNIYDFKTFYEYAGQYLIPSITPTPTPSITPSPTPLPIDCIWNLNDELWENNTNDWNECQNVITPTPTQTSTNTPTPSITPSPSPAPFDADAASFLAAVLSAGGTLNSTISGATNTLFTDLKSTGIYNELVAFYPAIGSTSGSTALNGKRTSSEFDIEWLNPENMTFNASGATGNGSNTGGNTFIIPNTSLTQGNRHMSFYSTGDAGITTAGYELGGGTTGGVNNALIISYNGTVGYFSFDGYKTYSNATQTGFYYTQISGSTSPYTMLGYQNGEEVLNVSSTDNSRGSNYLSVLGDNRANIPSFAIQESSDKRMGWASFGNELTTTQITQFNSIVNTFQTTLGRNTY